LKTVISYSLILILLLSACRDSADRPKGTGCFILGGCEDTDYDLDNIYFRLSFYIDGKYLFYQTGTMNKSEISKDYIITVEDVFTLCGRVEYDDSPVYASIRFIPDPRDSMMPSVIVDTDERGAFCTMLKGGRYSILISPYKQDTIPQLVRDVELSEDISDLTISYPKDDIRLIYGSVILDTKSGIPVEGINVVAFRQISNDIILKSNISTTDTNGSFSLVIPDSKADFSLMLSGSQMNPDWPNITFKDIITESVIQLQAISLGSIPPSRQITGNVAMDERAKIIATMKTDSMSYTKSFTTDTGGYFETNLREGTYDIVIAPEDIYNSIWSISQFKDIKIPDTTTYKFSLDRKTTLKGRIISGGNSHTPQIHLSRMSGCRDAGDNIQLDTSILPDSDGYFSTYLSQGMYRIVIDSDDPTGTPIVSNPLCIETDMDLGEIQLPNSAQLNGKIENKLGLPLSDIRLEILLKQKSTQEFVPIISMTINKESFSVPIPNLDGLQ